MSQEIPELREVVDRNAQAVMAGNFMQLMADITPEALAKLMQLMPQGGGPSLATMPAIASYELEHLEPTGDAERYRARFTSETAIASFVTSWKLILGQWKVIDFSDIDVYDAPPPPPPYPPATVSPTA